MIFRFKGFCLITLIMNATLISVPAFSQDMQHHSYASSDDSKHMTQHATAKSSDAHSAMNMVKDEVVTEGVVQRILADSNQLIVRHQPIPLWNMGAMQMKFNLAEELSVSDFQLEQKIRFRLKQDNMMKFTITELLE